MRRIWFDRHEPTIIDHCLTAAARDAQRAKGGDAATCSGHLKTTSRTDSPRRRMVVCPRSRLGSPANVTRCDRRKSPPLIFAFYLLDRFDRTRAGVCSDERNQKEVSGAA